jgi:hypothetical protein
MISEIVGCHHGGYPLPGLILQPIDGGDNIFVVGDNSLDVA